MSFWSNENVLIFFLPDTPLPSKTVPHFLEEKAFHSDWQHSVHQAILSSLSSSQSLDTQLGRQWDNLKKIPRYQVGQGGDARGRWTPDSSFSWGHSASDHFPKPLPGSCHALCPIGSRCQKQEAVCCPGQGYRAAFHSSSRQSLTGMQFSPTYFLETFLPGLAEASVKKGVVSNQECACSADGALYRPFLFCS
jgi:hypothetical protein